MEMFTSAATRWLATHHGVITTAQLVAAGVPRRRIQRLVRSGALVRVTAGVFVLAGSPATLHQRAAILGATHPGGFVTGPTAGTLGGLRRMPTSAALHFSLPHGINPEPQAGVRIRQTTKVTAADRMSRPDGIVVASWPRLAFDLAADLGRLDHLSVVNQMVDRGDVTVARLVTIGVRLCHPGRRGSRRFEETLAALGGSAAQQSHAEVRLLDALRARDVPVEPQVPVATPIGLLHLDLGVAACRWGVELDIHPEHRQLEGQQRDAGRRRATNQVDWQVEQVTELDLDHLDTLADRLAENYRTRRRRLLRPTA